MSDNRKLNILGTEYEVIYTTDTDSPDLKDCDGYCASYDKHILVETKLFQDSKRPREELTHAMQEHTKFILRHEIIHAFCTESGIERSALNEEWAVNWMAKQLPKMLKVFQEVDAI